MKWIYFFLLFISIAGFGQSDDSAKYIHYPYQYGIHIPRLWADSVLKAKKLVKFTGLTPSADTTTYKPLSIDASGNVSKMVGWPLTPGTDTTSLSNRINLKLNISDTTNKWINDIRRSNDSVYALKNGSWQFKYIDSTGGAALTNAGGTGDTLLISNTIKRLEAGYGINHIIASTKITTEVDTSEVATPYDLQSAQYIVGRNLRVITGPPDTLATNDTLISATPDASDNSTKVATTAWVTAKGYGTGSANAAGSTGDIQFKGSDGLLSAMPGSYLNYDSTNKILLIGNPASPTAGEAIEIDTGNIDIKSGGYKLGNGYMMRLSGNETWVNENSGQSTLKLFTGGTTRFTITSSLATLTPTLSINTTLQIGGVDVIKDLGSELHIGAGSFWKKTRFYSNGSIVGFIDTARWGFANTAPTATVHISARSQGLYGAGLKIDSFPLLTNAEKYAIENDGSNIYYSDRTATRYSLARTLKGSTTWDPASIGANSSTTTNITVTGAALGDPVTISKTSGSYSNGEVYFAYVSATDTVTIQLQNASGGTFDIASATYNVIVLKY